MKTQKIVTTGKFKVTHKVMGSLHDISIRPGTLKYLGVRNDSTTYFESNQNDANYRFNAFLRYARNENVTEFWQKLSKI